MSLGNHGIVRLVKYCSIWKKCKLPSAAENVEKTGDFWPHLSDGRVKMVKTGRFMVDF